MSDTEQQDPRYAGYVQRCEEQGKAAQPYPLWKARMDGQDEARARREAQAAADPRNPDDTADDTALDAAGEMARIAEQKVALAAAKEAELAERERRLELAEQAARERDAAEKVAVAEADLRVHEEPDVNASELGPLTHVTEKDMGATGRVAPKSLSDPDLAGAETLIFACPANRNRFETMQAGQKTVMDGQIVVLPHKVIEFTEGHYVADLSDPVHRERAEWLLGCQSFRKGEIVLVPTMQPKIVGVNTGPRTSSDRPTRNERHDAPLSVHVG